MLKIAHTALTSSRMFDFWYGSVVPDSTWSSYDTAIFRYVQGMSQAQLKQFCDFFLFFKDMPKLTGTHAQRVQAYGLQIEEFYNLYRLKQNREAVKERIEELKTKRSAEWWLSEHQNERLAEIEYAKSLIPSKFM